MNIEVEYADQGRKVVPVDGVDTLEKSGVLFVLLTTVDENGERKVVQGLSSLDRYVLLRQPGWAFLWGWMDGDFTWRKVTNGAETSQAIEPAFTFKFPAVEFQGATVSREEWLKVAAAYSDEVAEFALAGS